MVNLTEFSSKSCVCEDFYFELSSKSYVCENFYFDEISKQ